MKMHTRQDILEKMSSKVNEFDKAGVIKVNVHGKTSLVPLSSASSSVVNCDNESAVVKTETISVVTTLYSVLISSNLQPKLFHMFHPNFSSLILQFHTVLGRDFYTYQFNPHHMHIHKSYLDAMNCNKFR